MRRRHITVFAGALLLAAALSGCSPAAEFAVTLNAAGHVQLELCNHSSAVLASPNGDVLQVNGPAESSAILAVDLQDPGPGWTLTGSIPFDADTPIEVWPTYRYREAHSSTTVAATTPKPEATSATIGSDGHYVPAAPAPELVFRGSELRHGAYYHDGRNISPETWHDLCESETGLPIGASGLLILAAGFLCLVGVIVAIVWSIATSSRYQRQELGPGPERSRTPVAK